MHNKITQLQNILSLSNCDICALTETWLNDNVLDSEIFSDDFTVYRKDRSVTDPGKRGGGVLLAIKKSVKSRRRPELEPHGEIIVCEIICSKRKKNCFDFGL